MTDLAVSAPLRPMPQPLLHTDWPATLLMAGLVAACVAGGWWWASRREGARSSPKSSRGQLTPDDWALLQQCVKEGEVGIKGLFTSEERQIFRQLRQAFPEWTILAKVPLSSVTEPLRPDWAPLCQRGLMHIHLDFALKRLTGVIDKLLVYPENMQRNLDRLGGLVHSQRVLLALTQKGMSREDSYAAVQRNAMPVWRGEGDFLTLLKADKEVKAAMQVPAIREAWARNGTDIPDITGAQFGALVAGDVAKWRKVVTEAGVKLD